MAAESWVLLLQLYNEEQSVTATIQFCGKSSFDSRIVSVATTTTDSCGEYCILLVGVG